MGFVFHAAFVVIGYLVASTCEWAVHRYCMHAVHNEKVPGQAFKNINKQHIIHHNATSHDMTIRPTVDKYQKHKLPMKHQRFQGLYFIWPVTFSIMLGFFFGSIVVNFLLNMLLSNVCGYHDQLSYATALSYAMPLGVYMNIAWNYVHPTLHLQPGLDLSDGLDLIPRQNWITDTVYYNFLWKNHVFHHLCVGDNSGNFNVTLPAADWLFGTYRTECDGYKVDVQKKKIYKLKKQK